MSNYPLQLDTISNLPDAYVTGDPFPATVANNIDSAIISIETKVGTGASTPTVAGNVLTVTGAGATTWQTIPAQTVPTPSRVVSDTFSTILTPNANITDVFRVVLTGNTTLDIPSGTPNDNQHLEVHLIQDSIGSRFVSFGSGYKFATSLAAPTLSTAANATDVLAFKYSAAANVWRYYGSIIGF